MSTGPVEGRIRMRFLLRHTSSTLSQASSLLERQHATVDELESKGYPSGLARDLLAQMTTVVDTLRWQKAWIENDLRRTEHFLLDPQPHPWAEHPPPDLLVRICVEMQRIEREDPTVLGADVTQRAVDAAIARAVNAT